MSTFKAKSAKRTKTASDSYSILRGPLAGLTGILTEVRTSQRMMLSVRLLRQSVLVEVHPDDVTRIEVSGGAA